MRPRLLRGKGEDGREQLTKCPEDFVHRRLRRPSTSRVRGIAIHPVFGDVDVEAAQVHRAKLIQGVIDLVKLERFISRTTIANHLIESLQNPSINKCCSGGL